jgi:hypothetical protein
MNRHLIYILLASLLSPWGCSDLGIGPQTPQPGTLTRIAGKMLNWTYGDTNTIYLQVHVVLQTRRDSMITLDSTRVRSDGYFSLNLRLLPDSITLPSMILQIDSVQRDSARIYPVFDMLILTPSGRRIGWARNCSATFWSLWLESDYSAFFVYSDRDISDHRVDTGASGGKPYTQYSDLEYKKGWNKVVDRVTGVSGSHRTVTRRVETGFEGEWQLIEW